MSPGLLSRSFWNFYAWVYDTLLVFRPYGEMLREAADSVASAPGSRILDAGCGTGNLSRQLLLEGYQVSAVDSSPSMLARAVNKCPGVGFCRADLEKPLQFETSSFDAVTCSNVLYTLREPEAAIREFRRILRPGGRLILTNPVPGCSPDKILQKHWNLGSAWDKLNLLAVLPQILLLFAFNRFLLTRDRRTQLYLPPPGELTQMLQSAGFAEVEVHPTYADQSWLVVARCGQEVG